MFTSKPGMLDSKIVALSWNDMSTLNYMPMDGNACHWLDLILSDYNSATIMSSSNINFVTIMLSIFWYREIDNTLWLSLCKGVISMPSYWTAWFTNTSGCLTLFKTSEQNHGKCKAACRIVSFKFGPGRVVLLVLLSPPVFMHDGLICIAFCLWLEIN